MALMTAGYWPSTYWPAGYWPEGYWPEYSPEVTPQGLSSYELITQALSEYDLVTPGISVYEHIGGFPYAFPITFADKKKARVKYPTNATDPNEPGLSKYKTQTRSKLSSY